MKKKLLLCTYLTATFFVNAQNVGIGTITPLARLHVTDSSVLFSASWPGFSYAGLHLYKAKEEE